MTMTLRNPWRAAAAALVAACSHSSPDPPLTRIVAYDFGYELPAEVPAGLVHLRLVNAGGDIHEAEVVRFTRDEGSAARYVDSVRAHVDFPAFALDFGGAGLAEPGDSTEVWLVLAPGHYAVVCWKGDHLERGMAHDFTVVGSRRSVPPPTVDVEIALHDFSYGIVGPLTAGRHLLHVTNQGKEPHEVDLIYLPTGVAAQDYMAWLAGSEAGQPPALPIGGGGDFVPGREVWFPITLRPGRYLIICQVPSAADGQPHYALGMYKEFEVLP